MVRVVSLVPVLPVCGVVPVVECVPAVVECVPPVVECVPVVVPVDPLPIPVSAEPVLMSPWPASVGVVVWPGVSSCEPVVGACVPELGGEVIIVLPAPEAPDLIGPELIRKDGATTRRVLAAPIIFGAELEPGSVAVFALPRATRGRLPASARVPNPDSTAQAAPTATTTSRAAEIVRIMCLDQFTVITSSKDTRFDARREKPAQVAFADRAEAAAARRLVTGMMPDLRERAMRGR